MQESLKGTVFGNVGGNDKIASKFKLESLDNGNINIAVNGAGKIASTADGIAMYYYRVQQTVILQLQQRRL